jgi:hypothetical protein
LSASGKNIAHPYKSLVNFFVQFYANKGHFDLQRHCPTIQGNLNVTVNTILPGVAQTSSKQDIRQLKPIEKSDSFSENC